MQSRILLANIHGAYAICNVAFTQGLVVRMGGYKKCVKNVGMEKSYKTVIWKIKVTESSHYA
jgi:hypothetical protein